MAPTEVLPEVVAERGSLGQRTGRVAELLDGALTQAVAGCRHILIVDETRHSGGVAEALMAHFHETAPGATLARLTAEDSFIATGPAYAATMPSKESIIAAAKGMVQ